MTLLKPWRNLFSTARHTPWRWKLVLVLIVSLGLFGSAQSARGKASPFELANALPRGAFVYGQFQDLPEFIKRWNESGLKARYQESVNYQQFQKRHLGLKLMERYVEFNSALGFELDSMTMSNSAEKKAAFAVYDIGRMEMVFVAPMSDEKIAATQFFSNQDRFEPTELPDGTTCYSLEVEADRGRQKQKMVFAAVKGKFILATSEQLMLRTLANLRGKSQADRLSAEPAFQKLTREAKPHFFTAWVDQNQLNSDWYFRHYWVQGNVAELKSFEAGLFDLELAETEWVEHRVFLTSKTETGRPTQISTKEMSQVVQLIPDDVPFITLHSATGQIPIISKQVSQIFTQPLTPDTTYTQEHHWDPYYADNYENYGVDSDSDDWYGYSQYQYLDSDYDETINDPVDAEIAIPELDPIEVRKPARLAFSQNFTDALSSAVPQTVAVIQSPQARPGQLFAEFRKATLVMLQSPSGLNRPILEQSLIKLAQSQFSIAAIGTTSLEWTSSEINGLPFRQLNLPMLGLTWCYALKDRALVLANNIELLQSILTPSPHPKAMFQTSKAIDELTLIRLNQRKPAFDDIATRLKSDQIDFFANEISSVLDTVQPITEVTITRRTEPGRLYEVVRFGLQNAAP
ncbi:MAG TPA: hypothetical protein PKE58_09480 [Acidobacteriota bacterium]|nr:hypothetical protein [Acidobacteriota bacterium]